MKTEVKSAWPYQRRNWLVQCIEEKFYRKEYGDKEHKPRNFQDEAKAKLPALFHNITAYNKLVDSKNNKGLNERYQKKEKLKRLAKIGTDADCDRIAKEIL